MRVHIFYLTLILVYAIQNTYSMANEGKRVFRFTKVTAIQTVSNSDKIRVGKNPIATESTSAIHCAALLMQFGPFTCIEYYDLQNRCRSFHEEETVSSLNRKMELGWTFYNANNFTLECKLDDLGRDYRGKVNTTITGIQCMVWSAPGPHTPYQDMNDKLVSDEGPDILNTNYCRNADSTAGGPWCYTMNPNVRWQNCGVPYCQCYT